MRTLLTDLRHGVRLLGASPAFTAVAVAALALGIGANTAIFTVVNAVLLRSLPYRDPSSLMMVWEKPLGSGHRSDRNVVSPANYLDWKDQNRVFSEMSVVMDFFHASLTGMGEPEELLSGAVSSSFFQMLGVQPILGRTFALGEDQKGHDKVVLLSHALWQKRFGGQADVLGKTVVFDGVPHQVIGVLPADFRWNSRATDVWMPYALDPAQNYRATSGRYLSVLARLRPGVSLTQAQSELVTIARRLEQQYPAFNKNWSVNIVPLHEQAVGGVRNILVVLIAAVGFVLLIACVNVANLLLSRAAVRQREIAIRTALGAGRWRLIRQLLTESVLLAVAGGAAGLFLAWWGTSLLVTLAPKDVPRLSEVGIDWRVFGFTAAIALATGALFGLAPAIVGSKPDLNDALKETGRSNTGSLHRNRLRGLLVVAEMALALITLIGAGLMMRSFQKLQSVDPGFRADKMLTMRVALPPSRYGKNPQMIGFFHDALARIESLPGVISASAINYLPLTGRASATDFDVAGRPKLPGEKPITDVRVADPKFFRTMGIPLLRGREFTERDTAASPKVLIINEALARSVFPQEDPIGRKLIIGWDPPLVEDEIVGVVGDIKHYGLDTASRPTIYWPEARYPYSTMTLVVRTAGDPDSLAAAAIREIRAIDSDQPVSDVRTMNAVVSESVSRQRFNMVLLGIFAGLALLLAGVGIYGVMAYNVAQRTHEIGIRVALGASHADVMRLVVGQGAGLALAGIAAGLAGAFALTRLMSTLLYDVTPTDPATYAAVSALLALIGLTATYIPARRALRVEPVVALRCE